MPEPPPPTYAPLSAPAHDDVDGLAAACDEANEDELDAESIEGAFDDEAHGIRVDTALARALDVSRASVAQWLQQGRVRVAGTIVQRASLRAARGITWQVDVPPATPIDAQPQAIPITIVYEDDDVIVINKAPGMVVHPAPGHPDGTLVNALLHHCDNLSGIGGRIRPGIVHRIDRDTSGLLVATKNDRAHRCLAEQFAAHTIERVYEAVVVRVHGPGLPDRITIDTPHRRHPDHRRRFTGLAGGERRAITHVEVVLRGVDGAMRVRCRLSTGRTHQIRVHLSEKGCPLLGDPLYGGRAVVANRWIPRVALHAATLGFIAPDGRSLRFESALPDDLANAVLRLERGETWRA